MPKPPVRPYSGQKRYPVRLAGVRRSLPVVQIDPHTWIASDAELILGDVEFLSTAEELLAEKIRPMGVEAVLTAEAKSIALAYELTRRLGCDRFVVARKSLKSYMGDHTSERVKSITTKAEQELLLTREELVWLSGRRVCLLDDVVSTGGTLNALAVLAGRAGARVACKAAIWKEGPWYGGGDLVCIGTLPIFVSDGSPLAGRTE